MHVMAMFFQHSSFLLTRCSIGILTTSSPCTLKRRNTLSLLRGKNIKEFHFLMYQFNEQPIKRVSHIKFLGVIVDNNLSWAYHITSKMAKSTYQLARIKNSIDERCQKTFYHAYIYNKLEYGILLFGSAAAHQLRPLKSLQKRALKLVVKISSTKVFKAACLLPLQSLTDFQRSLLIMKSNDDKVPQYIKALFTLRPNGNSRFRLPLPRLDIGF